jgi:short-subunit dehydrogenase
MSFQGKSVVITGASAGIGAALAVALAARGARLVVAARTRPALDEVVERCEAAGGEAVAVACDVADPAACRALAGEAVKAFGGIDVLVNNAGISMWSRFEDVTDLSIFERLMRVNYLGAVHCTYHALPHLRARRGLVVAISSLSGLTGVPTRTGYAASKHAMQGFFDSLRIELRGSGVDVLVVSPGLVATDLRERALRSGTAAPGAPLRGLMPVDECVRRIVDAMARRRRELVMTAKAKLARWVKLVAPAVVDRLAERGMRPEGE